MGPAALSSLRAFLILLGFALITLPLMPVQWLLIKIHSGAARALPHFYHRVVCWLLGVVVEIEGPLPTGGLLVANHVSWADIPVLSAMIPLSFIAKSEVGGWPFFGSLARLQQTVFINRGKRYSTGLSRDEMAQRLAAGDALLLFAEGTSTNGKFLRPFKSSFFGAAENSKHGVTPVSISYCSLHGLPLTARQRPLVAWYGDMDLLPHLWALLKAGPVGVRVVFHAPLQPAAFRDRKALAAATEAQIRASLHARAEMG